MVDSAYLQSITVRPSANMDMDVSHDSRADVYQYVLGRVSPQNSRSAVGSTHVKSFLDTTRLSSFSGAPKRAPYAINRCGVADPATGATL